MPNSRPVASLVWEENEAHVMSHPILLQNFLIFDFFSLCFGRGKRLLVTNPHNTLFGLGLLFLQTQLKTKSNYLPRKLMSKSKMKNNKVTCNNTSLFMDM